jgi:16S rRNA (guanine527-N7)-methyltransferase
VSAIHGRVEDLRPETPFPQIVSRAFSDLSDFVRLTAHLLAEGGEWLAMKGLFPNEEIAQLKGARVKRDVELRVPGLEADRHLIVLELA